MPWCCRKSPVKTQLRSLVFMSALSCFLSLGKCAHFQTCSLDMWIAWLRPPLCAVMWSYGSLGTWWELYTTEVSTNVSALFLPQSYQPYLLNLPGSALECNLHSTILLVLVNHSAKILQELCCFEIFCTKINVLSPMQELQKSEAFVCPWAAVSLSHWYFHKTRVLNRP